MSPSRITRLFWGLSLLTVPTVVWGGLFLVKLFGGLLPVVPTPLQTSFFRAGHAHAGVLLLLSLLGQLGTDWARLSRPWQWVVRISLPLAPVLVSTGFFLSAASATATQPGGLIVLTYLGAACLMLGTLTLGIGLVRAR